ncbi:MAG: 50S ribosomal protein L25/general stress protein Ctc [Rickettsiales bacterium]|nr:50S ribosomal protein L25/general stress protein Ctc [Rickettsiales bacterium]
MVNFLTLNGSIRSDLGSANTRRLRKDGRIPAVIYGNNGDENIYISISKRDFDKEYMKSNVQLKPIELNLDGKKYKVLVYQIDLDPVTDMPRHVDFNNVENKKELKIYIPVNFLGKEKAPGIKKGGFLNVLKRKIECFCNLENIPSSIDIDVSKLHIGSKIKISDITLPNNVKNTNKSNFDICSITGRGKSTEEEAAATAAATAVAATATPAATTPAKTAEPAKK